MSTIIGQPNQYSKLVCSKCGKIGVHINRNLNEGAHANRTDFESVSHSQMVVCPTDNIVLYTFEDQLDGHGEHVEYKFYHENLDQQYRVK